MQTRRILALHKKTWQFTDIKVELEPTAMEVQWMEARMAYQPFLPEEEDLEFMTQEEREYALIEEIMASNQTL